MGFVLLVSAAGLWAEQPAARPQAPEGRAVAFLVHEVPRWSAENKCFSCHNNGDAARALYVASRHGFAVPPAALADTSRWLTQPSKWDDAGGEGPAKARGLGRIQFAAALAEAVAVGAVEDRPALRKAAALVAEGQQKDGSWQIEGGDLLGTPATYGTALATRQARRTLALADPHSYRAAVARADEWLRTAPVKTVLDAAAVLLALEGSDDAAADAQRKHCRELIRKGESPDGGWGPYVNSGPEVFDTALVLLALARLPDEAEVKAMLRRGRGFLIAGQQDDGGWRETTRPSGAESYAQRLSTSGWATLALLATRGKPG